MLENFQTTVKLNKLYKTQMSQHTASDQINPSIFVNSGSINIYAYNGATEPASLGDMVLSANSSNISAVTSFGNEGVVPSYMAFVQNTGTSTEIVLSGVEAVELKEIGA